MAAGYWLIYTINEARETVHQVKLNADADKAALIAKLRELVRGDLSPGECAEVARLPDGGSRMEVHETETGYVAGAGPTYWAKFIFSV